MRRSWGVRTTFFFFQINRLHFDLILITPSGEGPSHTGSPHVMFPMIGVLIIVFFYFYSRPIPWASRSHGILVPWATTCRPFREPCPSLRSSAPRIRGLVVRITGSPGSGTNRIVSPRCESDTMWTVSPPDQHTSSSQRMIPYDERALAIGRALPRASR